MWVIHFEDGKGRKVDSLEFNNFRKARECFDALVLQDFAKAVLCRENGTLLDLKTR